MAIMLSEAYHCRLEPKGEADGSADARKSEGRVEEKSLRNLKTALQAPPMRHPKKPGTVREHLRQYPCLIKVRETSVALAARGFFAVQARAE